MTVLKRFALGVAAVVLALAAVGSGCLDRGNVAGRQPYSNYVGREYRVIGEVDAYPVKASLQDATPSYVTLIPAVPGVGGREYFPPTRIARGTTFRIVGATHKFILFEDGTRYLVAIQHAGIPPGVEVRLALFRGNEGAAGSLNPKLYEEVSE